VGMCHVTWAFWAPRVVLFCGVQGRVPVLLKQERHKAVTASSKGGLQHICCLLCVFHIQACMSVNTEQAAVMLQPSKLW
jgi:hypothetical protein